MASALVLATILIGTISSTSAHDFYVGGRDGWVQNPTESYDNWSSRMRFQVNDKLVFKYNKDQDSVLVVKKEDYDSCNTNSPTQKLEGGDSTFRFTQSGPFYFISGVSDRCAKGEKLMAVVIAPRNKKPLPPPLPPSASPPSISPLPAPANSPSSSPLPSSPSVAPTPSPSSSPSASPANAPTPSPSSATSPANAPTPSPSSSSSASPATTPTPSPSSSASPAITTTPSPSSSPSASPAKTPTPSPSSATSPPPSSSEVSPAASPPKQSSAASSLTASSLTIWLFVLVLSHVILG